jgi:hypothetical protein
MIRIGSMRSHFSARSRVPVREVAHLLRPRTIQQWNRRQLLWHRRPTLALRGNHRPLPQLPKRRSLLSLNTFLESAYRPLPVRVRSKRGSAWRSRNKKSRFALANDVVMNGNRRSLTIPRCAPSVRACIGTCPNNRPNTRQLSSQPSTHSFPPRKIQMKCFAQFVVTLAVLVLFIISGARAQTVVSVYKQPLGVIYIGEYAFITCANNGTGQWIYLFGPVALHATTLTYSDGSRRTQLFSQIHFTVTPLETNNVPPPPNLTYQSIVTFTEKFLIAPDETSGTRVLRENFIIAAGSGINFHFHELLTTSFTIDAATGQLDVTAYHGNISLSCN